MHIDGDDQARLKAGPFRRSLNRTALVTHHICNMHVSELWRYPIKSLKGERLKEAQITPVGIPGDRGVVVIRSLNGRILTARVKPKLLGLQGTLSANGVPTINGHPWDSPEAHKLATDAAGEAVTLVQLPAPQAFDVLPLLVATDRAARFLNIDHRRLRPNILITDVPELEERRWPGKTIAIGEVRICAEQLRDRCVMTTFDPTPRSRTARFCGESCSNWMDQRRWIAP